MNQEHFGNVYWELRDVLIINNNKHFTTNSEIFKVLTELTDTVNNIKGDTTARKIKKKRN